MTVVTLPEIMNPAFENRYGVPAFNAVDDITMDGLIKAAEKSRSPLIIQISVKTIKFWGAKVIKDMFTDMAERVSTPVTLHLDHCPDPEAAKACLQLGWNSVLFDGSALSFEENFRITQEITKQAAQYGAHVEGEVVPVAGVEDDIGSDAEGGLISVEKAIAFVKETGIYCYAPAIGTAHGFYQAAPEIRYDRMQQLVEATHTPMVLHGGSGLSDDVFQRLISLGTAKVNISTALKQTYADGFRTYLEARPTEYNPLKLIGAVRSDVMKLAQHYFKLFGSQGRA
ncbi:MAG: class II fructose-bisphosphate aldolase [Leptolyngbyaceae cyanobacterium MO_188.B28]|nr:class II fructose-bisphosphate aldolase [Leptolyngbyaceae cyanobacterium MO_188.B28]